MKQEKFDLRIDLLIFLKFIITILPLRNWLAQCAGIRFYTKYNLSGEILLLAKAPSHSQHIETHLNTAK